MFHALCMSPLCYTTNTLFFCTHYFIVVVLVHLERHHLLASILPSSILYLAALHDVLQNHLHQVFRHSVELCTSMH